MSLDDVRRGLKNAPLARRNDARKGLTRLCKKGKKKAIRRHAQRGALSRNPDG